MVEDPPPGPPLLPIKTGGGIFWAECAIHPTLTPLLAIPESRSHERHAHPAAASLKQNQRQALVPCRLPAPDTKCQQLAVGPAPIERSTPLRLLSQAGGQAHHPCRAAPEPGARPGIAPGAGWADTPSLQGSTWAHVSRPGLASPTAPSWHSSRTVSRLPWTLAGRCRCCGHRHRAGC